MNKTPYVLPIYVWYDLGNCPEKSGWYWDDVKDRPFHFAVGPFATRIAVCRDAREFFDCQVTFVSRDPRSRYSIEMPFPDDCAPYKIISTNPETGKRTIVSGAMTREDAERELRKFQAKESKP